jgi:hypothetical protein
MFAMKTIEKKQGHQKYVLTEKDILVKMRHVSYQNVGWMRKPEQFTRILPAE